MIVMLSSWAKCQIQSIPKLPLVGFVILFVGIRIAWRLTQGRSAAIQGPFDNAAAAWV
jgi:hypothetical protein